MDHFYADINYAKYFQEKSRLVKLIKDLENGKNFIIDFQ